MCGYIHEGEEPPEKCPVCGAEKEKFVEVSTSLEESDQESNLTQSEGVEDTSAATPPQDQPTLFGKISDLILENHLHPISVHSPNGIVPVAVAFLFLALLFNSSALGAATYFNMIAVLLSMPLVLATGYITWQKKYQGAMTSLFKMKIAAGIVATAILFGLVVWKTVQPDVLTNDTSDRYLFLGWSVLLLAAVGLAGHLGGQLVFANKK